MPHFGIPRSSLGVQPSNLAPFNWRRGMFRVWVVLSAAWIVGWVLYLAISGLQGAFKSSSDLAWMAVLLLGPPVALLMFGLGAGWAFRGFNPDEKRVQR